MKEFPIVVASAEGWLALLVTELTAINRLPSRDAIGYYFRLRLAPGQETTRIAVVFSKIRVPLLGEER